jgi:hypothetical protein
MPPAAALAGSAVGSIAGGIIQGNAANNAAQAQAQAAAQATALQKQVYDQSRQDWQPYQQAGTQALSQLQDPSLLKSFGASDFQQDPGYQFRMDEGQKALERSAAARGGLMGGATAKALTQYGQNFASNEYQNAYNRFNQDQQNRFGRLSSLTGYGTMANQSLGQAGQSYANNAGQNMIGAANGAAGASMASGNAFSGALSGLAKAGMDYGAQQGQYDYNQRMNKLMGI